VFGLALMRAAFDTRCGFRRAEETLRRCDIRPIRPSATRWASAMTRIEAVRS
jgi:hypothetical protein